MRSTSERGQISTRLATVLATIGLIAMIMPIGIALAAPPGIALGQCRNGSASAPNNCVDLGGSSGWVNGNVGATQGHLIEGYSIPYRAVITNAPTATSITVVLGYDIKHSSANAIDYLTHYDRLLPHGFFGHPVETIDPISGTSAPSTFTTFAIPAPSNAGSPVAGQPTTSFNGLPAAERLMTLYGGTITAMAYVSQGSLTAAQSETQISVTFTLSSANAVLAWGGHIGRGDEWNGASASAISGSPYHMRLKAWNIGNVGNQDRSLSAGAVINPPKLIVIKNVVNDNGGTAVASDFTINVSGGGSPSSFAGAASPGTTVLFPNTATYNVTENAFAGYTASFSTDCSGTITVEQTKTCTVTNDDSPATPSAVTEQSWVLHDTAYLLNVRHGASQTAASVSFKLYGTNTNGVCSNQVGSTETFNNIEGDADDIFATSTGVAVTTPGTYYWVVTYSGNNLNTGFSTTCGSESTTITAVEDGPPATP